MATGRSSRRAMRSSSGRQRKAGKSVRRASSAASAMASGASGTSVVRKLPRLCSRRSVPSQNAAPAASGTGRQACRGSGYSLS